MSDLVRSLEKDIDRIKSDIANTSKMLEKLERQRSDAMYYIKLVEQNLKYMRKRDSIPVASHFEKTARSKRAAEKEVEAIDVQISNVSNILARMNKNLEQLNAELARIKERLSVKILPFRKKR